MMPMRSLLALVMALMLGVTSITLASARGHAPAVGQIELCTGMGMQMISVDAEGNPVGDPHVCPDGVAALAAPDLALPVLPPRLLVDGEKLRLPDRLASAEQARPRASARAPPVA